MYDVLAHYYDLLHASLTADRDYILALVGDTGGPVLELGCGTGRITIPIARAGYHVTGVDNSGAMLVRARRHLHEESPETQRNIELLEGDMRELSIVDPRRLFQLVLLPYNTLLHFRAKEILSILRNVASHLHLDGRVFIDLINPFVIDSWSGDQGRVLEDVFYDPGVDQTMHQYSESWLDSGAQRLHTRWIFEVQADSVSELSSTAVEFDYWYQFPHQLELLLEQSGLLLETLAGDYDGSSFDEASERLLVTARRRKPDSG